MRNWKGIWRGAILASAVFCATLLGAPSSHAGIQGGYVYLCSPICTGARMSYIEPQPVYVGLASEVADAAVIWVGIEGGGTCATGPLVQHGTYQAIYNGGSSPEQHDTWHQEYPCDGAVNFGTVSAAPGDEIFIQILCTTGCTEGSTTSSITYTWTNVTQGITQSLVRPLNGTGSPAVSATMFWDKASFVIEKQAPYPYTFTPLKIIHPEVFQSGAWVPVPWQYKATENNHGTTNLGSNMWNVYSASPLVSDGDHHIFYICDDVVLDTRGFTSAQPCPASQSTGSYGMGP